MHAGCSEENYLADIFMPVFHEVFIYAVMIGVLVFDPLSGNPVKTIYIRSGYGEENR